MTPPPPRIPPHQSDRWSARLHIETARASEFPRPYVHKAPESMARRVSSPPPVPERRGRVSAERLARLGWEISPRDRAVLTDLMRFGFLTTDQLQAVHFPDMRTPQTATRLTRRTLQRLAADHLVARVDRRVGGFGSGSSSTVWRLAPGGQRLLQDSGRGARLRVKLPSARFLDHRLALADCYVDLIRAAHAGRLELLRADPEPASWRSYLGPGGVAETLKPDLYAVTANGDYEDHWFCEIDRATESLPTIRRKCGQYERYRRTGREQQSSGVFPLVVWVVPDEERADDIRRAIDRDRQLDAALYRVTTSAAFRDCITGGAS